MTIASSKFPQGADLLLHLETSRRHLSPRWLRRSRPVSNRRIQRIDTISTLIPKNQVAPRLSSGVNPLPI